MQATHSLTHFGRWLLGLKPLGERTPHGHEFTLIQESPLAGFQHHRAEGIWPFLRLGEPLDLRRDYANLHDPNAIAVWFRNDMIGYIPKRENATLAQMMDRGCKLQARIIRLLETDNPWRRIRISVSLIAYH